MPKNSVGSTDELAAELATKQGAGELTAKPELTLSEYFDQSADELAKALKGTGVEPDRFIRTSITTIRTTKVGKVRLDQCTNRSLLGGFMLGAQFGFNPGPTGHFYLIPRWDKQQGAHVANFQIGYQGWKTLALRSAMVHKVEARAVYAGDDFDYEYGTNEFLRFKPNPDTDRIGDTPTHVYALAQLQHGVPQFHVMTWGEIQDHRERFSDYGGVWKQHPIAMAQKTVFLQLKRWLPSSIELEQGAVWDGRNTDSGLDVRHDEVPADVIDVDGFEVVTRDQFGFPDAESEADLVAAVSAHFGTRFETFDDVLADDQAADWALTHWTNR